MSNDVKPEDLEPTQPRDEPQPTSARGLIIMTLAFVILIGLVLAAGPIRKMVMG